MIEAQTICKCLIGLFIMSLIFKRSRSTLAMSAKIMLRSGRLACTFLADVKGNAFIFLTVLTLLKFNKKLNRKRECVKYFDIKDINKTSSKNEANLMKGCGFESD